MVKLAEEGMTMAVVTHEMGFARRVAAPRRLHGQGAIAEDRRPPISSMGPWRTAQPASSPRSCSIDRREGLRRCLAGPAVLASSRRTGGAHVCVECD